MIEVGAATPSDRATSRFGETRIHLDGSVHPDFVSVAADLGRQLERSYGGAALCVYHRGDCVVDPWGGRRDAAGRLWGRDTLAPSFSTTKGVASTLVHMMVDRGLLEYDVPVATWWPEFAAAGKGRITLRQVLSHQAGLYHVRQMIDHAHRLRDWDHMVSVLERAEPIHTPGEATGYHGLTFGFLVGEVLQRVTGRDFSTLVREEIAEPLGLSGLHVGASDTAMDRAAELLWPERLEGLQRLSVGPVSDWMGPVASRASSVLHGISRRVGYEVDLASIVDALVPHGISDFDFGARRNLEVAIPAANGLFDARSLARMYAALAAGGRLDGVHLISSSTLARATERQPSPGRRSVIPLEMGWRLGYHGVMTSRGIPRSAFGHFGFGGSGAWADPSRNLAVAMTVNAGMGTPFGDARIARMSGAVLGCARKRDREGRIASGKTWANPALARVLGGWGLRVD